MTPPPRKMSLNVRIDEIERSLQAREEGKENKFEVEANKKLLALECGLNALVGRLSHVEQASEALEAGHQALRTTIESLAAHSAKLTEMTSNEGSKTLERTVGDLVEELDNLQYAVLNCEVSLNRLICAQTG